MVLFERFLFDQRIYKRVQHHSVHWKTPSRGYMIAMSWALDSGDWWRTGDEPAKFFSWERKRKSEEYTRTGVYVGRFALVFQTSERPNNPNEVGAG